MPSVPMPNNTGKIPVITDATGAIMPILPMASPLYRAAMPNAPVMPAATPQYKDEGGGIGSWLSQASKSINTKPQACAPATTLKTLARLVAIPPAKSPPPQTPAAPKLSAAPVTVPEFIFESLHASAIESNFERHELSWTKDRLGSRGLQLPQVRRVRVDQEGAIWYLGE